MAVHPVGHGLMSPQEMENLGRLNRAVHGLGIASLPLLFLGALALTRQIADAGRLAWAALVFYGFGAAAIMIAASMSGFVASDVMSKLVAGDPLMETRRLFLDYTFRINQAFASVSVVASSVAIILWSIVWIKARGPAAALGYYGLALGTLTIGFLFAGHLRLDVHGFGLVVLAQSIWFIISGVMLIRSRGADAGPDHLGVGGAAAS